MIHKHVLRAAASLVLAASVATPQSAPVFSDRASAPTSIVDIGDGGLDADELGFLNSTWTSPGGVRITAAPLPPRQGAPQPPASLLYQVQITPPSGFKESFLFQTPLPVPQSPTPLLVGFHAFGRSHLDILNNTDFPAEAAGRGWFLVAPLGASKKHFSIIESQINTEAVLEWVLAGFSAGVDPDRIYGVGFSMGGGAVMNYAARHLDPSKPILAAVVDHSGGVALKNTYFHDPAARAIMDDFFGNGTPGSADPWKLARSSVVNFDPVTLVVEAGEDLARNLVGTPLKIQKASTDSIPYVNTQCDVLDQHLRSIGKLVGPKYAYESIPPGHASYGHAWAMMDFKAVCDWLSTQTLRIPLKGDTLADQDARYYHFDVVQDAFGVFTPFSWFIDRPNNELRFDQTANLARVTVDLASTGLDPAQPLRLIVGTTDGIPDQIVLSGVANAPAVVTRDSVPNATNWSFNRALQTLTVSEFDGNQHTWEFAP